jgi:hypothetical protein
MRTGVLLFVVAVSCAARPAETPGPVGSTATTTTASTTSDAAPTTPPPATSTPPAASTGAAGPSAAPSAAAPPASVSGGSVLVGDIPGTKKFNPKPIIEESKPAMVACYNKARAAKPDLSGKIKLLILVNGAGAVVKVDAEPGGTANDAVFLACLGDAFKTVPFPKPGGMATVVAPMVFRP